MSLQTKDMRNQLLTTMKEKELVEKLTEIKNEFNGMFDENACLVVLFQKTFPEQPTNNEDINEQFLKKWKNAIQQIISNKSVKDVFYAKHKNELGFLPNFRFAESKNAEFIKKDTFYAEKDFSCFVFVLGNYIRNSYSDEFVSSNIILWETWNETPKLYNTIFPAFLKELSNIKSINGLFKIHYSGLITIEGTNGVYTKNEGTFQRICKIKRLTQSKLSK